MLHSGICHEHVRVTWVSLWRLTWGRRKGGRWARSRRRRRKRRRRRGGEGRREGKGLRERERIQDIIVFPSCLPGLLWPLTSPVHNSPGMNEQWTDFPLDFHFHYVFPVHLRWVSAGCLLQRLNLRRCGCVALEEVSEARIRKVVRRREIRMQWMSREKGVFNRI